jgi:hypothetical protein
VLLGGLRLVTQLAWFCQFGVCLRAILCVYRQLAGVDSATLR